MTKHVTFLKDDYKESPTEALAHGIIQQWVNGRVDENCRLSEQEVPQVQVWF